MRVEVVYALPHDQRLVAVDLEPGATVADAVAASGLADVFPEIDARAGPFGVFGEHCAADRVLEAGDRVEIYRPLAVDPREARRLRARARRGRGDAGSG